VNRRGFLGLIAAAAPAALIFPELIMPKRSVFLPPSTGWAQPSLADLWLRYAGEIVPAGVAVMLPHVGHELRVVESFGNLGVFRYPGMVSLELPRDIDAATEWRMRRALSRRPTYHYPPVIADLTPWVDA
jgi:hypothetical protein